MGGSLCYDDIMVNEPKATTLRTAGRISSRPMFVNQRSGLVVFVDTIERETSITDFTQKFGHGTEAQGFARRNTTIAAIQPESNWRKLLGGTVRPFMS